MDREKNGTFKKGHRQFPHKPNCPCQICNPEILKGLPYGFKKGQKNPKEWYEKRHRTFVERYGGYGIIGEIRRRNGYVISEETRKRMSEASSRRRWSEEHKKRLAERHKKIKSVSRLLTAESQRKANETKRRKYEAGIIVPWNKGLIGFGAGPSHHWYVHGSRKYEYDISRREWEHIAREIKRRDNYTCQVCGMRSKILHVHHKKPYRASKDNSVDNLITLCLSCHRKQEVIVLNSGYRDILQSKEAA